MLDLYHLKDKHFGKISYGEQKRVLIARALVFNPEILLLDEPTGGLDITSREEFLIYIEKLIEAGHSIIYVTHHTEEIVNGIDKILIMKNGEIFAHGNKEDILRNDILSSAFDIDMKIDFINNRYWTKIF